MAVAPTAFMVPYLADHGHPSWYSWYNMGGARLRTEAAREVQEMLTNLAAAHTPSHATSSSRKNFIAMFNNSHTHQEVLDLIAEARARMS